MQKCKKKKKKHLKKYTLFNFLLNQLMCKHYSAKGTCMCSEFVAPCTLWYQILALKPPNLEIFSSQASKFGNFQFTRSLFQRQVSVCKPHTSEIWATHPYLKKKENAPLPRTARWHDLTSLPTWNRADCTFLLTVQRFSRAGPRGRGREWVTLGVHPLSWLLSNNRLEEVCGTLTKGIFSSRLLLSNQDKGCTPSVANSLPLPLGPALLNLWIIFTSGGHAV